MMRNKILVAFAVAFSFVSHAGAKPTLSADEFVVDNNGQGFWQVKVSCDNNSELTIRQAVEGDKKWCYDDSCNADKASIAAQACKLKATQAVANEKAKKEKATKAAEAEKRAKAKAAEAKKAEDSKRAAEKKRQADVQKARVAAEKQRRIKMKTAEIAAKKREIERQKAIISELESTLRAKEQALQP